VKKDGRQYEIIIAGVDKKGNIAVGYFKGKLGI